MVSLSFALVEYDVPELLPLEIIHLPGLDSFDEFLLFRGESVELILPVDEAGDFLFQQRHLVDHLIDPFVK